MGRGLGRLQRFIKEQVYRVQREWDEECAAIEAAGSNDEPQGRYWLWWFQIRSLIENDPDLNPGPYRISPSLERSAKRALLNLVKRGEVAKVPGGIGRMPGRSECLAAYITKETYQESFSDEADERWRQAFTQAAAKLKRSHKGTAKVTAGS